MVRIIVAPQAEADFIALARRITKSANTEIAESFLGRMRKTIVTLSRIPLAAGHLVPNPGDGLRCHPFGNYNTYLRYIPGDETLYVVRVLNGRRNITKSLFKQQDS